MRQPLGKSRDLEQFLYFSNGADGGGRTHTLLRVPDFESSASANSATSALMTPANYFTRTRCKSQNGIRNTLISADARIARSQNPNSPRSTRRQRTPVGGSDT